MAARVLQYHKGKNARSGWGFPVGLRSAAAWENCPELDVPEGATELVCDQSTCTQARILQKNIIANLQQTDFKFCFSRLTKSMNRKH